MEGKTEGKTEGKMEGKTEGKMEGKTEGKTEGKMEGKTEGKTEGKMEGKTEGKMEGKSSRGRQRIKILDGLVAWLGERTTELFQDPCGRGTRRITIAYTCNIHCSK